MRPLIHWWRRRGMLPQTEKLDRLRALMQDETPKLDVRFRYPDERVRPVVPWWMKARRKRA